MSVSIHPLTESLWPRLESLFGPQGACYGCWCTHFRLAPKVRAAMDGPEKRDVLRQAARAALAPGLIALDGETPVGWVQVTPRAAVPRWNTERTVSRPLDGDDPSDPAFWAISCFFIQSKWRGQGISHALVRAAIDHAARNGARVLEACPMFRAQQSKSIGLFVGSVSVFTKAGFEIVAERKDGRPLMRKLLA